MKSAKKYHFHYDFYLMFSALAILAIGLLMVASASMVISDRQYGFPFHYLIRQIAFLGLGLLLAVITTRIKLSFWQKCGGYLVALSIILLIAVLVPGIGREVNGSMRWINLGPLSLQVSEFAKLSVVIFMAGYLVRREEEIRNHPKGFIKPLILLGIISLLLLQEPDFGATTVMTLTALGMLFIAGVRLWQFAILLIAAASALALLAISAPYRLVRLTTFLHPWANQFDSGYQLTQSLIAFGRGGIWGVGLGNSIQKLFYLPEAHTDFLFAVLAEELGLIGELMVLGLFIILIGRILWLSYQAMQSNRSLNSYLACGLGLQLGLQVMINIGVNIGLLPTKGLTLPMMSYGGSSMLMNCIVLGILLRIAHETPQNSSTSSVYKSNLQSVKNRKSNMRKEPYFKNIWTYVKR